jgi:hypothetical protein
MARIGVVCGVDYMDKIIQLPQVYQIGIIKI